MTVEWGRASRGRNWHLLERVDPSQTDDLEVRFTLCQLDRSIVEVNDDRPPRGGIPCPRCADVVEALTFAVLEARTASRGRTPETLDSEPDLV